MNVDKKTRSTQIYANFFCVQRRVSAVRVTNIYNSPQRDSLMRLYEMASNVEIDRRRQNAV